jgi:hypothetical protein
MPLRNTRIIPRRWQGHFAGAVVEGMQARVRLSHPAGLGTRNATTGRTPQLPPRAYYEGPARIQVKAPLTATAGETGRELAGAGYLLAVPIDVGDEPRQGDLVDVLESPDPLQAGLRLYVTDVPTATEILQRNLGADLHAPTPRGG